MMRDTLDHTGYHLSLQALGAMAAEAAIAQLYRYEKGFPELQRTTLIRGEWMAGETL